MYPGCIYGWGFAWPPGVSKTPNNKSYLSNMIHFYRKKQTPKFVISGRPANRPTDLICVPKNMIINSVCLT